MTGFTNEYWAQDSTFTVFHIGWCTILTLLFGKSRDKILTTKIEEKEASSCIHGHGDGPSLVSFIPNSSLVGQLFGYFICYLSVF